MEDFKNNFNARRDEIYAFLKTMQLIEKNESDNPGSFSKYLWQGASSDEEAIPTYRMIANILLLLTLPDRTLVKFIVRKFISYCLTERFRASNMQ